MIAQERQKKELSSSPSAKAKMEKSPEEYAGSENANSADVAEYLADLLEGARGLAGKAGLTFLAYLIQVAVEEAKIQAAATKDRR
jgi:hypothetical protein